MKVREQRYLYIEQMGREDKPRCPTGITTIPGNLFDLDGAYPPGDEEKDKMEGRGGYQTAIICR